MQVTVTIDRPMGSFHPQHKNLYYPINYGYIKGIIGGDGEYQDAYVIGVDIPLSHFTGKVIAIIHRFNDNEDKWVIAPISKTYTKKEIEQYVYFQEQFFEYEIEMMISHF